MVDTCGVFLKKQWFIKSKPEKIENSYLFDPKKVYALIFYNILIHHICPANRIRNLWDCHKGDFERNNSKTSYQVNSQKQSEKP